MSQPQSQESLDDEWERSEEALRKLQINSPSPPLPSSIPYPVVQKSGNPGGQIYDDRTPVPVPVPRPVQQHGNTSSGQIYEDPQHQPVRSSPDEYIDSALTDTVQNPQERMNLLKFENKILHFVKSRWDQWVYMYSSFFCVVPQLIWIKSHIVSCHFMSCLCFSEKRFSKYLPCRIRFIDC